MLLRWLLTVFPREVAQGGLLLRPDLALWIVVALAAAGPPAAMGGIAPVTEQYAADPRIIVASLAAALLQLAVVVLLTTKLSAITEGRTIRPSDVLEALIKRALPLLAALLASGCVATAAFAVTKAAVILLLRETPYVLEASTAVAAVVYVSLLVRYAFVPFVVVRDRYEMLDLAEVASPRWPTLAVRLAWPLFASTKMTERITWSLAPYVILIVLTPTLVAAAPERFRFAAFASQQMAQMLFLAILFRHYRQRRGLVFDRLRADG